MDHRFGHLLHIHHRFDGNLTVRLFDADRHALGDLRQRVADVDLSTGDVVLATVERNAFGQAGHRVLGAGVGHGVGARRMGRDRAVVDDAAASRVLVLHDPKCGLRTQEHAGEVDVDHGLPFLQAQVLKRDPRRVDTGVVEQQVDAAEPGPGLGKQRIDLLGIGDVGGQRKRAVTSVGLGQGLLEHGRATSSQRHAIAGGQQRQRCCLAYAGTGAGDNGHLVMGAHGVLLEG